MASSSRAPIPAATQCGKAPKSPESFESLRQRNAAAEMLQSYEMLSWWSFQRCESLTQTRLHFQNIVAGFTLEDEASWVDWKTDNTPRPKSGEEQKQSRKGKERASAATGGIHESVKGSSSKEEYQREKKDSTGNAPGSAGKKRKSGSGA